REYRLKNPNNVDIWNVVENEVKLTKVCYQIEKRGFKVDVDYIKKCLEFESNSAEKTKELFKEKTGQELVDSNKALNEFFKDSNVVPEKTKKGADSFSKEALENSDNEIAKIILTYR